LDQETINSDDLILQKIEDKIIQSNFTIKYASFDHISSAPSFISPMKRILDLCRKYGIVTFVDGAHSVGQINLNISDLNPDFYVSNFHKWGYAPKSAAFLYVNKTFQNIIHPNIISNNYKSNFTTEFAYTGTRDYSQYLSIKDCINFRKGFGENELQEYIHNMVVKAGDEVAKIFGTEVLIKDSTRYQFLVNVRLPSDDKELLDKVFKKALYERNIVVVVFKYDGHLWTRISGQIYNELDDYIQSAKIFMEVLKQVSSQQISNDI